MRRTDLNKKCAIVFSAEEHQLLAEALAFMRFYDGEITENEVACLNKIVSKLRGQVDAMDDLKRDEAVKRLKRKLVQNGVNLNRKKLALAVI